MNKILLLKKVNLKELPTQPEIKEVCDVCKANMVLIDTSRNGNLWICDDCNNKIYITCDGNFGA